MYRPNTCRGRHARGVTGYKDGTAIITDRPGTHGAALLRLWRQSQNMGVSNYVGVSDCYCLK